MSLTGLRAPWSAKVHLCTILQQGEDTRGKSVSKWKKYLSSVKDTSLHSLLTQILVVAKELMLNIIERKVTSVPHNQGISYKQNEKFEISKEYESLDQNRNFPE